MNKEKRTLPSKREIDIYIYDVATSSNDIAKELAKKGEKEGTIVLVNSQTNGKGRLGRSFISSSENGLYFTLILRPSKSPLDATAITTIAATALCEAIRKTSEKNAQIKWINDVYINDKKCAGILVEGQINSQTGALDHAVVGMGINILPPKDGFDSEISEIATSIFEKEAPCGYKTTLLCATVDAFFEYYTNPKNNYIDKYKELSCIIGKNVDIYIGNEIINGKAIDIDSEAHLVVSTKAGVLTFNSGEARVRGEGKAL